MRSTSEQDAKAKGVSKSVCWRWLSDKLGEDAGDARTGVPHLESVVVQSPYITSWFYTAPTIGTIAANHRCT